MTEPLHESGEPLATYSDKSHVGERTYALYPEHIAVTHRDTVRVSAEGNIRLRELNPDYVKIAVRTQFLNVGVWMTIIPGLIYWGLIELTRVDPFGTFAGFFLAMTFAGVFVSAVGLKKQHLVRFRSQAGVATLEVFREGPQKKRFDDFIAQLQNSIRKAQSREGLNPTSR